MSQENLVSYLKDHLAGSVAGVELVTHLRDAATEAQLRDFLSHLKTEIEADQAELKFILQSLNADGGEVRKAMAWMTEKASWTKMAMAGTDENGLGILEGLEALLLGITGKRALWQALALTNLTGDFPRLQRRAEKQLESVEFHRLAAANAALCDR
jgi:hypothetical protein